MGSAKLPRQLDTLYQLLREQRLSMESYEIHSKEAFVCSHPSLFYKAKLELLLHQYQHLDSTFELKDNNKDSQIIHTALNISSFRILL